MTDQPPPGPDDDATGSTDAEARKAEAPEVEAREAEAPEAEAREAEAAEARAAERRARRAASARTRRQAARDRAAAMPPLATAAAALPDADELATTPVTPGASPRQVRHGRLRTPHPVLGLLKIVGAVVAVVAVSAGSVAAYATYDVLSSAPPTVHLVAPPGKTASPPPEITALKGEINLLLVATDTRKGQGAGYDDPANIAASDGVGNNDVNLLIHVSDDHQSMAVISLPRDLAIPIPACPSETGSETTPASSKDLLNSALGRGGLSCAVSTVESITGLTIPYAAEVTFKETSALSTAVGGVQVCLATDITDDTIAPNLNLKAGLVTLEGDEAGSFLRTRHGVGDGSDLGRINNQQVFLSALMRKMVDGGTLSNPATLYKLAKVIFGNTTRSDTLDDPATLVKMAVAIRNVGLDNIVFARYPVVDDPANAAHVVPDPAAAETLNKALKYNLPLKLTGGTGIASTTETAKPTTPSTPATTAPGATPTTNSTASPGATPTPSKTAAVLPTEVLGQTAAEQTCSLKGNY